MYQHEAVIQVMRANGGIATLAHLYKEVLKVPEVEWKTKTPFKSINRIVQDERYFYKIRPGLWALLEAKQRLEKDPAVAPRPESDHTFYQGLVAELGSMRQYTTFIPRQDSGRPFMGKKLDDLASIKKMHPFSYEDIVSRASTVDVVWFVEDQFPVEFIEIENSTDISGKLLKFLTFAPFHAIFRIVAPSARRREFEHHFKQSAFNTIRDRVKFNTYEEVSELHSRTAQLRAVEANW